MSFNKKIPLAGKKDARALMSGALGVIASNPLFAPNILAVIAAGVLPIYAGGWLRWRDKKGLLDFTDTSVREAFVIASDAAFGEFMGNAGIRIGYTKDRNLPVDISNGIVTRHVCIIGSSGVGKTTLGEFLLMQQTARMGGWLMIDAKLDKDTRDRLRFMADLTGRSDEYYVLNVDDPDNSNTYNPLLKGDADEKASRLLNLLPSSENSPGSDFYRQSANHALTVLFGALDAAKYRYTFTDLAIMLQSAEALSQIERMVPAGPEKMALQVFLDNYRKKTKEGVTIDIDRLKQVLGGMVSRLAQFAQGKFGKVFNTYTPEIDLADIVMNGKMLYVMLPTMGKDSAAYNLGKMILSDLRTAVYNVMNLPKPDRPSPPFLVFADEFGSYTMAGVARIFEQSRAAQICMIVALQSFSQLNQVSADFADMIVQNTWTKIFFKFGSNDSPERAAEIIGNCKKFAYAISKGESAGKSAQATSTSPTGSESGSGSFSESWRETEDFRVTPDQLKSLAMGEAVVMSGARVFHVRTPMLEYPEIDNFRVIHHPTNLPADEKALGLADRYREFLLNTEGPKAATMASVSPVADGDPPGMETSEVVHE